MLNWCDFWKCFHVAALSLLHPLPLLQGGLLKTPICAGAASQFLWYAAVWLFYHCLHFIYSGERWTETTRTCQWAVNSGVRKHLLSPPPQIRRIWCHPSEHLLQREPRSSVPFYISFWNRESCQGTQSMNSSSAHSCHWRWEKVLFIAWVEVLYAVLTQWSAGAIPVMNISI